MMAGAPQWKIYDAYGTYQAACKEIEGAACLMGLYGDGATIRFDHAKKCTVWTEGKDGCGAESWDLVVQVAYERKLQFDIASIRKQYGDRADEMLAELGLTEAAE